MKLNYIAFACIIMALGALLCIKYDAKEKKELAAAQKEEPIELVFTSDEIAETERWKNRSMDDLAMDACNGDRGALYMMGMALLMGYGGWVVDVEMANDFFAKSASLGFAPALDKIRYMYLYDDANLFLMLVYLNLTISSGHSEFIRTYHELRQQVAETFGKAVVEEIERIAIHKQKIILQNKKKFEVNEEMIFFADRKITDEDVLFNNKYFQAVCDGNSPESLEEWISKNYGTMI